MRYLIIGFSCLMFTSCYDNNLTELSGNYFDKNYSGPPVVFVDSIYHWTTNAGTNHNLKVFTTHAMPNDTLIYGCKFIFDGEPQSSFTYFDSNDQAWRFFYNVNSGQTYTFRGILVYDGIEVSHLISDEVSYTVP